MDWTARIFLSAGVAVFVFQVILMFTTGPGDQPFMVPGP